MPLQKMQVDLAGWIAFLRKHQAEFYRRGWAVKKMMLAAEDLLAQGVKQVDYDHDSQRVIFMEDIHS